MPFYGFGWIADVNAAILRQQNGEKEVKQIRGHAEEWVANNKSLFDGWIEEATKAAN